MYIFFYLLGVITTIFIVLKFKDLKIFLIIQSIIAVIISIASLFIK
jgi:hypothetical protein